MTVLQSAALKAQAALQGAALDDTISNFGSTSAAPAAGAVIISLPAAILPAGRYKVSAIVFQTGTPDANVVNGAIKEAGTTLLNIPSTSAASAWSVVDVVTLDGATNLNLTVGPSAGGAGAVYNGVIAATRISA